MSLVELFLASANSGGVPGPRPNPAVQAALDDASDRETEAALESRVRTGKSLTPSQRETLAEIRARRGSTTTPAPIATVAPPAAAIAPPIAASPSVATTSAPAPNTPAAWRAEFERSPDLQREFGTADLYCTYRQGVADGRIRHHGGAHRGG